ncbi:hypothetical protein ABG067_005590 [Albugo candida]
MRGLSRRSWIYATTYLIVWLSFGSSAPNKIKYYGYAMAVKVTGTPYYECYEAIIKAGATRIAILFIDIDNKVLHMLFGATKKIRKDRIWSLFLSTQCHPLTIYDRRAIENWIPIDKTSLDIIVSGNDECDECLFKYCVIYRFLPSKKELYVDPTPSFKGCLPVCNEYCVKLGTCYLTNILQEKPITFSNYKNQFEGSKSYPQCEGNKRQKLSHDEIEMSDYNQTDSTSDLINPG